MGSRPHFAQDEVTVVLGACDGQERAAARELALRAAGAMLEVPRDRLGMSHEPSGRPVLGGAGRGLHVGLSHTRGGLIAVALTGLAPVGVDVEVVRPLPAADLARRWFRAEEAAWVAQQPADLRARAFLWLWTHKEAMGKALGLGLRGGGMRRPVTLPADWPRPPPEPARLVPDATQPGLNVASPEVAPDVVLAVATHGAADEGGLVVVHVEQCLDGAHRAADAGWVAARNAAGSRTSFPLVVRANPSST